MFSISKIVIACGFQNTFEITINFKRINIIVGPNNSGKSTILKEIEGWFNYRFAKRKLLRNVEVSFSGNSEEYKEFENDILDFEDGQRIKKGEKELIPVVKKHLFEDSHEKVVWINLSEIKDEIYKKNTEYFRQSFFRFFIIRLDGKNRFQLIESKHFHIFRTSGTPFNYLSRLYLNAQDQRKLAEIVNKEFRYYTYLKKDDTFIDILLSKALMIEINGSTGKNTGGLAKDLLPISECGDGVKCFISICLSILSCPFRIVLIDEPEAYLHPPTAYSLGKNLSQWVNEKHRSLIVSTHSSEFLMGCLQSVPISDISIVRLTYQNNISTVKQLEDSDISLYAKDPLLRSSDVLNALFNDSAVVTEGGDDKIVYQEANNRLVKCERGINNTIFLNANGKYVVHRIIRALRKIGVPAAAIYDFDVLRNEKIKGEEKTLWRAILSSSNIDSSNFDRLENERQYIESKLKELNRKNEQNEDKGYFKKLVSDEIPNELEKKIGKLLNELNEYGIFIVPIGEIEQWLKNINDTHDDDFINILNKIDITTPTNGDIWKFIDDISIWISNSNRKGMFC